ncbi:bifunctional oligoribonuclease/PAP phosphatase NrnA [Butyrivibrio sp. INlla16]|uniref:DHH family phosphoesterase n=1 Tax=Butyrivibrio sp. INlla16 TaxID=1520807 RepID=UPI000890AE9C|nr:bifunctional oligoribonuclease/PAP phosphatase NrnA [Butyrivibrio sp. INlla16]SDB58941.1 phosphoesterase RecJ domain-containing protein [Butyrivibrio sp. INlla16]
MRIDELVKDAKTIGIGGHIRPDGDCVGSTMALYLYLKKHYPNLKVDVFLEKIPESYKIIEATAEVKSDFKTDVDSYDIFFALDCGKERLGDAEKFFDAAKKTVNIDHHVSNEGTGDENYIVPTASSACELVYDCIDKDKLDAEIAKAIYMGIITDTGVFKYSNTSPATMQVASDLIGYGFDFGSLIDSVFYEKTYVQNQIMGRALLESMLFMHGDCIVSVVSRQTMDFYHAESSDLDGIVSQLLLTTGTECAIFMYEIGSLEYKVSLRSKGKVNVAKIAELFGGGGHSRAAGCTMNGTQHDIINSLSEYIERDLKGVLAAN